MTDDGYLRAEAERESPPVPPADSVCGHSGPTRREAFTNRVTERCGSCGAVVDVRRLRRPYVGEGADGARRSAQIDREEAGTLSLDDPRHGLLIESAIRWDEQAEQLDRIPPKEQT